MTLLPCLCCPGSYRGDVKTKAYNEPIGSVLTIKA